MGWTASPHCGQELTGRRLRENLSPHPELIKGPGGSKEQCAPARGRTSPLPGAQCAALPFHAGRAPRPQRVRQTRVTPSPVPLRSCRGNGARGSPLGCPSAPARPPCAPGARQVCLAGLRPVQGRERSPGTPAPTPLGKTAQCRPLLHSPPSALPNLPRPAGGSLAGPGSRTSEEGRSGGGGAGPGWPAPELNSETQGIHPGPATTAKRSWGRLVSLRRLVGNDCGSAPELREREPEAAPETSRIPGSPRRFFVPRDRPARASARLRAAPTPQCPRAP